MSITKSISALSILFLIQDKLITDIDTKVSNYFTEWNYDKKKNITIEKYYL